MSALKQAAAGQMPLGAFGTGNIVKLDGGKRLRLDDKVDFFPLTQRWESVDGAHNGSGVSQMLAFLKAERERAGSPVHPPAPLKSDWIVVCKYCKRRAELHLGAEVYPARHDLADRTFWVCWPCNAWVGCHGDSHKPLGELADEPLRNARMAAHAAFDPVWKDGLLGREAAYEWLAQALAISRHRCHIGMMELDDCLRVSSVVYERFGVLGQS